MTKANKEAVYAVKEKTELLSFIQQTLQGISRNKAKSILVHGSVRIGRQTITKHDFILEPGMQVTISKSNPTQELRNRFVKIIYEDKWILVIEKQPGILSMGTSHHSFCVKTVLDDYLKKKREKFSSHVVHRLDRETSGLMIYAKSLEAEKILEENWHNIVSDRRYVAVVQGKMEAKQGTLKSWLKDNKAYFTYSSQIENDGKLAITHFKTLASNDDYSLVELKLETGRKNQIRVHMQDLNHPIVGDIKYGSGSNPIGRLALHAYRLYFRHPMTNELMEFETPIPYKFKELVNG